MEDIEKLLMKRSKRARMEQKGIIISFFCISLIIAVVISIFYFVAIRGIATFSTNGVKIFDFLFGQEWNPSQVGPNNKFLVGALPIILGSFIVTFLASIFATPFAIGTALFMVEISPKRGKKILQPAIELLVGIPSVVYGFIGLSVIVPFIRSIFGGTGFSILSGSLVLFIMILPTITTMTVDSLKAVPRHYREASLALGATRWQTIYKVTLRASIPGILTAIIFGMSRAFGESLAVQMVIGNSVLMPSTNLAVPSSTLTSILTMGIGNTIMGSIENNVLWSLALNLLVMSLFFNIIIRLIAKKGVIK